MRFREYQAEAHSTSRRLVAMFVFTIALTVAGVNAALWLAWRLLVVDMLGTPRWFFEANTAMTLLFVLGGWWVESLQLRQGGAHVAHMLGGREITAPRDLAERRLRNVVHEMTIASGLPMPRVFVLDREEAINAFASGWTAEDSAITVTHGALQRLTRDELQGVVAHEFGHIQSGDTRLNMRLIGMVFGLQMVYTLGQTLAQRNEHGQHSALALLGWALMGAGSIGWLAGRLLKAAVSRQREFLADAHAVQFTRLPDGLGKALLKVAGQRTQGERLHHPQAELVSHLLLSSDVWVRGGWLASHPPLAERIRRLLGRVPPDLPANPVSMDDEPDHLALHATALAPGAKRSATLSTTRARHAQAPDPHTTTPPPADATATAPPQPGGPTPPPDCLSLPPWSPPSAIRATLLAFLVPGPDSPEHTVWLAVMGHTSTLPQAQAGSTHDNSLASVWALPARQRQPWLEHALHRARSLPPDQQASTLRDAVALVRANGRASLHEFLILSLIRQTLIPATPDSPPPASPASPQSADSPRQEPTQTQTLTLADCVPDIWCVSLALGQLAGPPRAPSARSPAAPTSAAPTPTPTTAAPTIAAASGNPEPAHAWANTVLHGLGLAAHTGHTARQAAADHSFSALDASIRRLARLGALHQPALVKQWCQPGNLTGEAAQPLADALRCLCLLIGSPMPPALLACFDTPTAAQHALGG